MRGHGIRFFTAVAALTTSLVAANAFAQAPARPAPPSKPTPRLADGKPNLGLAPGSRGYWGGGDGPLVQGANYGKLDEIPFQPWARGLYTYRNETLAKDDPYPKCVPHGGPRQFAAAGGVAILQMPEIQRIYIISGGAARSWRVIFMDGRPHPDINGDLYNPGFMGHSVGRWEGDTLVVETNNVRAGTLDRDGVPYSDKLTAVERIRRVSPTRLEIETTLTDPEAFAKPFTIKRAYVPMPPGSRFEEYL